jgi:hypothetical protein
MSENPGSGNCSRVLWAILYFTLNCIEKFRIAGKMSFNARIFEANRRFAENDVIFIAISFEF